jgi:hypothetical protein
VVARATPHHLSTRPLENLKIIMRVTRTQTGAVRVLTTRHATLLVREGVR